MATAAIILCACNSNNPRYRDREQEQKNTYSPANNTLQARLFLFHSDSAYSQLYYQINTSELLYKKSDTANLYTAQMKLFCKYVPYADSKSFFDTVSFFITDKTTGEPQAKILSGYVPIRTTVAHSFYIEATVSDVNGTKYQTHFITCNKSSVYTQQNFLFSSPSNQIFFSNKIETGNKVTAYNARSSFNKVRVDFFSNDYSLPPPPFSERSVAPYPSIPDSTFYEEASYHHSFGIPVSKRGVYYIRLDSVQDQGCVLMGVEKNFPKVLSHEQMIASTRFIMSREEYQQMVATPDKQTAIDNFWLSLAGNEDRARELIKRYYNRVQDANAFFTSHIEGWKTDMGMIYLVFGPPNKTYKTQQMETWVYGTEGTPNSATFRFEKINNPFSENNFRLARNVNYKDVWTIAVTQWREGHVYLDTK